MPLQVIYPEIPPTSNHIYFKGTILTKVAREYAERFAHHMAVHHLHELSEFGPKDGEEEWIVEISIHFYFESLINDSYNNPKVRPSKRAKSRYKRLDLDNRIKLLTDCIRDALAIDDSLTFEGHHKKCMDPLNPRVEIYVNRVDPSWYGIPKEVPMR